MEVANPTARIADSSSEVASDATETRLRPDDDYKRDALWKAVYETFYYVYYDELLCDALVGRWLLLDQIAKLAMALTATGSAVAGWTLWSNPAFRILWASIAGFGAICAIVHTSWGIAYRLRQLEECKNRLQQLRIHLETFQLRMSINPDFPVAEMETEFLKYRERFCSDCLKTGDLLITEKLRRCVQSDLNGRIGNCGTAVVANKHE